MVDIEALKELGAIRRYNVDDYIFKEGDTGSEMYIVLSGKVQIVINSFSDYPLKLSELGPGEFFGEMSILEELPRSASAIAIKDTILISINKFRFQAFISKQPTLAYKIMKGLSTRVRSLNDEMAKLRSQLRELNPAEPPETKMNQPAGESKKQSESAAVSGKEIQFDDRLFPKGHKSFSAVAPEVHETFLFEKPAKCPACGKAFNAKMIRMSKLKLLKTDQDMRRRYADFEPLWYSIWVCPDCYYTSYHYDFESLNPKLAKAVAEKTRELNDKIQIDFKAPHDINRVFTTYYLALYCAGIYKAPPLKFGKLWLQLSWLYRDFEDEEMAKNASMTALENYHNAFYNSKLDISAEEEQQCCMILGELFLQKGDVKEAAKHYHKAINRGSGSPALNQQAQDRLFDIRQMAKEQE